jgi:putative restriction endonuclease
MKGILVRRGQRAFRDGLIGRYGEQCVISGCQVLGVLEAAHIRPYRGPGDNHPSNGLLLRSDLHTLFDLDRIGIHPDTLNIVLHEELEDSEYASIKGKKLLVDGRRRPDREALVTRWNSFTRRYSTSSRPTEPGTLLEA